MRSSFTLFSLWILLATCWINGGYRKLASFRRCVAPLVRGSDSSWLPCCCSSGPPPLGRCLLGSRWSDRSAFVEPAPPYQNHAVTHRLQAGCEKLGLFRHFFLARRASCPPPQSPFQNSDCVKSTAAGLGKQPPSPALQNPLRYKSMEALRCNKMCRQPIRNMI